MAQLDIRPSAATELPIDIVENVISAQGWRFNRIEDDEMAAEFRGQWCDYNLHFAYATDIATIHLTCAFDIRVPERKITPVYELLALINDRMWLGHFGIWKDEGLPLFRHSIPLRGAGSPAPEQVEDLVEVAVTECERFFPAFQFVIWGGKSPNEAFAAAILDPVGEA